MYSEESNVNNNNNICNHEFYSIQHYLIKFVGDFRQVSDFFHVLRFAPPIQLTATFNTISVISWWSVSLMEETGEPRENHRHTISHNVVHLAQIEI